MLTRQFKRLQWDVGELERRRKSDPGKVAIARRLRRRHWRELLPEFVHRFRLKLHAYVMMSNHYHLLVEAPEANLSLAMQWLQTLRQLGELSAGIDYATVSAGLQRIKRRLSTDRSLAKKAMRSKSN